MSTCYPEYNPESQSPLYYVEFGRGGKEDEFTIFKRNFFHSEEVWAKMEKPFFMHNEVHPWNIFTAEFGPDGCMPDRNWVKWMVDAMNEKCVRDNKKS